MAEKVIIDIELKGLGDAKKGLDDLTKKQAEQQFNQALQTIHSRLRKAPFERLIKDHEKQLLHMTFFLKFNY